jgi:hypothetical protein
LHDSIPAGYQWRLLVNPSINFEEEFMSDNQTVTMDQMGNVPPLPPLDGPAYEPPKKSKKTMWIIIAIVVVLLCCCCTIVSGLAVYYWPALQGSMNGFLPLVMPVL